MSKYGIQKKGTGKAIRITGQKPFLPTHPSNPGNPFRPKLKDGGRTNTRRENRLEELGRVDAEKADSKKGKKNLKEEKSRIRKELATGSRPKTPKWPKGYDPQKQKDPKNFRRPPKPREEITDPTKKKKYQDLLDTRPRETINPKGRPKPLRRKITPAEKKKAAKGYKGGGMAQRGLGRAFMKGGKV